MSVLLPSLNGETVKEKCSQQNFAAVVSNMVCLILVGLGFT